MTRAEKIIAIAKSYIGQQEVQPNLSFKDPSFLAKMVSRGWEKGQAWCSYFAKQCWVEAYADNAKYLAIVKECGSGGALNTLENYRNNKNFAVNTAPVPGAIVIFEEGHGPNGHAGIVTAVDGNIFLTVEGNTNTDGSRDGYEVAAKSHELGLPFKPAGLNIAGFIHPVEI
jgi:surface antigen